ncbi:unnamed protein product [Adineta steineri]|uniref:Thymidylate synthase n=1 Tax=Adineta steineri TaxID=433720 RepID=A0A814LJV4_9BILA|nr:unnamed protein product [Adineta steineri]CAF3713380.1 unnamed protein product [Adineta steineri]
MFASYENLLTENAEETQYLDLVRQVIEKGLQKTDRTGVGTRSIFGPQNMKFNLRNNRLPLLTTKRMFWKGIVEELIWMIGGKTDSKLLDIKGVKIWNDHGSRAFLDKQGFKQRDEGDLGPIYGFQWRHWGAPYTSCYTDYTNQGIDQLAQLIHLIKTEPNSRRLILSSWNVSQLSEMVLPPCPTLCQFNVSPDKELSCLMFQRSCDLGLGVPFDIASYSLLTHIIASVCHLTPGDFIYAMGDAHVYLNHIEPLKEQLQRKAQHFPTLIISKKCDNIDEFQADDFKIDEYSPHGAVQMKMAI